MEIITLFILIATTAFWTIRQWVPDFIERHMPDLKRYMSDSQDRPERHKSRQSSVDEDADRRDDPIKKAMRRSVEPAQDLKRIIGRAGSNISRAHRELPSPELASRPSGSRTRRRRYSAPSSPTERLPFLTDIDTNPSSYTDPRGRLPRRRSIDTPGDHEDWTRRSSRRITDAERNRQTRGREYHPYASRDDTMVDGSRLDVIDENRRQRPAYDDRSRRQQLRSSRWDRDDKTTWLNDISMDDGQHYGSRPLGTRRSQRFAIQPSPYETEPGLPVQNAYETGFGTFSNSSNPYRNNPASASGERPESRGLQTAINISLTTRPQEKPGPPQQPDLDNRPSEIPIPKKMEKERLDDTGVNTQPDSSLAKKEIEVDNRVVKQDGSRDERPTIPTKQERLRSAQRNMNGATGPILSRTGRTTQQQGGNTSIVSYSDDESQSNPSSGLDIGIVRPGDRGDPIGPGVAKDEPKPLQLDPSGRSERISNRLPLSVEERQEVDTGALLTQRKKKVHVAGIAKPRRKNAARNQIKYLGAEMKIAVWSSPFVSLLALITGATYVTGAIYFGKQAVSLANIGTQAQLVRRAESNDGSMPIVEWDNATIMMIQLNCFHLLGWLIILFLINYVWTHSPNFTEDSESESEREAGDETVRLNKGSRIAKSSGFTHYLSRLWHAIPWRKIRKIKWQTFWLIILGPLPMGVFLVLGGRQLTSITILLADPNTQIWSRFPDVTLSWRYLKINVSSADDPNGQTTLYLSMAFWFVGIGVFLYVFDRVLEPGTSTRDKALARYRASLADA